MAFANKKGTVLGHSLIAKKLNDYTSVIEMITNGFYNKNNNVINMKSIHDS